MHEIANIGNDFDIKIQRIKEIRSTIILSSPLITMFPKISLAR